MTLIVGSCRRIPYGPAVAKINLSVMRCTPTFLLSRQVHFVYFSDVQCCNVNVHARNIKLHYLTINSKALKGEVKKRVLTTSVGTLTFIKVHSNSHETTFVRTNRALVTCK